MRPFCNFMLTIPRHIKSSTDIPSIFLDGLTLVQYQRRSSDFKHEICVSQHSLVFILEGTKLIHSASGDIKLGKGEAFFIRKGCHIMSEMVPEAGGVFNTILFFFNDSMFNEFVDSLNIEGSPSNSEVPSVFKVARSEPIEIYLSSIAPLFGTPLARDEQFLRLKVRELLHYICASEGNEAFINFLYSCRNEMKSDLASTMERYFNKNISLEDMAELSGRSLSTFKREFQKLFGTTPARWIRDRRLAWSAQLIRNSAKSISEISYESGYESLSHFSSLFRKNYGITPREYRSGLKSSKSEL
ncbi:helix-turn-helix domain-containing protein [Desulfovibrio gilichinskyi]|uniref:AraC-type DNA-binding protein n=1 Tax=Desulfovibrio gilichinskyi TaxID=1519643 RepID=A0A1X7EYG8_9BACT|nr:helix-turn-helix domain-containing protein [Desulfovibrio gilichinskyi]SMF42263.1 AraC-type DNA-binding protein [Desulfovibrio gilichinskyi]